MNMKRFITVAVVFALGWISFGIGSALSRVDEKVTKRDSLGWAARGYRWYYKATCNCPCEEVKVRAKDDSWGNPWVYVATDNLPRVDLDYKCSNCVCVARKSGVSVSNSCKFPTFGKNDSFFIVVHAYTMVPKASLEVEGNNIIGLEKIPVHTIRVDRLSYGDRRHYNVTCDGECDQVTVFVWTESGNTRVYLAESPPKMKGWSCHNCFCRSEKTYSANRCEVPETIHSFFVTVIFTSYSTHIFRISVEGLNVIESKELRS